MFFFGALVPATYYTATRSGVIKAPGIPQSIIDSLVKASGQDLRCASPLPSSLSLAPPLSRRSPKLTLALHARPHQTASRRRSCRTSSRAGSPSSSRPSRWSSSRLRRARRSSTASTARARSRTRRSTPAATATRRTRRRRAPLPRAARASRTRRRPTRSLLTSAFRATTLEHTITPTLISSRPYLHAPHLHPCLDGSLEFVSPSHRRVDVLGRGNHLATLLQHHHNAGESRVDSREEERCVRGPLFDRPGMPVRSLRLDSSPCFDAASVSTRADDSRTHNETLGLSRVRAASAALVRPQGDRPLGSTGASCVHCWPTRSRVLLHLPTLSSMKRSYSSLYAGFHLLSAGRFLSTSSALHASRA